MQVWDDYTHLGRDVNGMLDTGFWNSKGRILAFGKVTQGASACFSSGPQIECQEIQMFIGGAEEKHSNDTEK